MQAEQVEVPGRVEGEVVAEGVGDGGGGFLADDGGQLAARHEEACDLDGHAGASALQVARLGLRLGAVHGVHPQFVRQPPDAKLAASCILAALFLQRAFFELGHFDARKRGNRVGARDAGRQRRGPCTCRRRR